MRRNYVVTSPFITIPVGGISSTAKTVTFLVNLNFMNLFTIDGVQDGASVLLNELIPVKEAVLEHNMFWSPWHDPLFIWN